MIAHVLTPSSARRKWQRHGVLYDNTLHGCLARHDACTGGRRGYLPDPHPESMSLCEERKVYSHSGMISMLSLRYVQNQKTLNVTISVRRHAYNVLKHTVVEPGYMRTYFRTFADPEDLGPSDEGQSCSIIVRGDQPEASTGSYTSFASCQECTLWK